MKSPRHRQSHPNVRFRMLSKQAQERLVKYEYAVIWLLVLIAITSIVWSISLHIVSGDFNNGIIGAKLIFRERDFAQMDKRSRDVFNHDLGELINRTYSGVVLKAESNQTSVEMSNQFNNSRISRSEDDAAMLKDVTQSDTPTGKPKKRRILHLFQTSSSLDNKDEESEEEEDDEDPDNENSTVVPKRHFDASADAHFLSNNVVDVEHSFWRHSIAVQFAYSFPFLTEIVAIIWTAMCLVFQSGVKKYWGLPKPWRIVVPSIFVFTLMTLGTMIYMIITNRFLKLFCSSLREPLTDPTLISCGEAMSVLRPIIKRHQFHHDVYLNLFRICYILSFLLWALALVIMVLRYVFAIDFQLVDVGLGYQNPNSNRRRSSEQRVRNIQGSQSSSKVLRVDERARHKSEDDFQSAKSNISEIAAPLIEKLAA